MAASSPAARPRLVTVVGDAGVGKTRLLGEFWRWLGGQSPRPLLRSGRCLSYGHGTTYWPLGEVLKEHFGILDSDPPEVAAERVAGREGLGFTLGLAPPKDMHPLTVRDRLQTSWVGFLQELTASGQLRCSSRTCTGPMMSCATCWRCSPSAWPGRCCCSRPRGPNCSISGRAGPARRIGSPAGGVAVSGGGAADRCAARRRLPSPISGAGRRRAEGNPFFVEELIATLADRGVLGHGNGGWSFDQLPPGFSVPDTVQAVLAARIDLLPRAEKAALQTAAVIGRVFWSDPVRELVPGADPDFGMLEDRDFVHRHADSSIAGQREYVIKHALTREVAYESLLKAKRGPLHAGFAQWLERNGKGEDEHAPLLAHHYAEAVRPEDLDLAWPGREGKPKRCAARRSGGCGGPRSWPSAATRSTRAWPCSTGPSASKADRGSRPRSGTESAWPAPSSTTESVSGRPCSKRWTSAVPPPRCMPTSLCKSVERAGMWVQQPD